MTIFLIVCNESTSQENVMWFQIKIWLCYEMKQDVDFIHVLICMFIVHFRTGRQQMNKDFFFIYIYSYNKNI